MDCRKYFFHVTIGVSLALLLNRKLPGSAIFRLWLIPSMGCAAVYCCFNNGEGCLIFEYGAIISNYS